MRLRAGDHYLLYKKRTETLYQSFSPFMVEVTGFEPATFWSRTKRATKLRYTSMYWSQ